MTRSGRTRLAIAYVEAVLAVGSATLVRELVGSWAGAEFSLFHVAIALSAWRGGLGPGLMATVLSGFVAQSLLVPHSGSTIVDQVRLFAFLLEGGVITILFQELRGSRRHVADVNAQLEARNAAMAESLEALEREVRERRLVESSLRSLRDQHEQQARRFELILKWARDPMIVFSPRGEIEAISESAAAAIGRSRDTLAGTKLDVSQWPAELVARLRERVEALVATRQPVSGEGLFPGPHGLRDVEYVLSPVVGGDGGVESILATVRDVTARRQQEALLREREAFFRAIFEHGPFGIAIVSPDGRILHASHRLCSMLGLREDDLAGRPFADFIHPADQPSGNPFGGPLGTGDAQQVELEARLVTTTGRAIWTHQTLSAMVDADNQMLYGFAILEDIEERRRAVAEREALEQRLRDTQKFESLGVLAGGIAHDFNNLLVPVLGNAELILDELPEGAAARTYAQEIVSASQRAAQLARQMLAYSGRGRFEFDRIDLNGVVGEMRELLSASMSPNAHLKIELQDHLPRIEGDRAQMRQVVLNLVANAAESLGTADGRVRVRTSTRYVTREFLLSTYLWSDLQAGEYVCLEVSDTGCGMDDTTRARMFEPFFSTKAAGRGLGLPVVLGTVRGQGGAVHVDSVAGVGTTVLLLFPPKEPGVQPAVAAAGQALAPPVGSLVVLLVEDDDAVRTLTVRTLLRHAYEVLEAADGERALSVFAANADRIGCALVDILIPKVPGDEVCRRLRAQRPDLPIVAVSGYHAGAITEQLEAIVDAVVQKPFSPATLLDVVGQAIAKPR